MLEIGFPMDPAHRNLCGQENNLGLAYTATGVSVDNIERDRVRLGIGHTHDDSQYTKPSQSLTLLIVSLCRE